MISLSQTQYGSGRRPGGARHGSARRWRSYQSRSALGSGMGRTRKQPEPSVPIPEPPREPGLRAVGVAASRLAAPIVAKAGGGVIARIKAAWPAVAGAELAAVTWPESLGSGGVLRLRVAPAHALELQHRAPLVVERVNAYFGREVATRLSLVQGPLPFAPPRRPAETAIPTAAEEALDRRLTDVADSELRAALAGLGRAILATPEREG